MNPSLPYYQNQLLYRWLDNRPTAGAFLALNTKLGVRLACLNASLYLIWLFRQLAGMSEWALFPRGIALACTILGLGYLVSAFCGWASRSLQRRINQQVAELQRELAACTALMAEPATTTHQPRKRFPKPLPMEQRQIKAPAWTGFPLVPTVLFFYVSLFLCFKEPSSWIHVYSQKLTAAPFLTRQQQQVVIQVDRTGTATISRDGGSFRPFRSQDRVAELSALRAEGIRECVVVLDASLEAETFFALRAQITAAGFDTLYIGEKVYFPIF